VVYRDEKIMEKIKELAVQKFEEKDLAKVEFKMVREFR
jgi:hypothetical protein